MRKQIATIVAVGAVASALFAGEPAKATGDPAYTTLYRSPTSCTSNSSACNVTSDYALNPNNNNYMFYATSVYYQKASVATGNPALSAFFYDGVQVSCALGDAPTTGWQGPFTSYTQSSFTEYCTGGGGDSATYAFAGTWLF